MAATISTYDWTYGMVLSNGTRHDAKVEVTAWPDGSVAVVVAGDEGTTVTLRGTWHRTTPPTYSRERPLYWVRSDQPLPGPRAIVPTTGHRRTKRDALCAFATVAINEWSIPIRQAAHAADRAARFDPAI